MQRPCPTDQTILRGPRGGYYYLTSGGNRVYCNPVTLQPLSPLYQARPIVEQQLPRGAIPVTAPVAVLPVAARPVRTVLPSVRPPLPPPRTVTLGRPLPPVRTVSLQRPVAPAVPPRTVSLQTSPPVSPTVRPPVSPATPLRNVAPIKPVSPVRPLYAKSAASESFGVFQQLPADIRRTALTTVLPYDTLLNLCKTSREYQQICQNPQTWLALLQKGFNWQPSADFLSILAPQPAGGPSNERIIYEFLRKYPWTPDQLTTFIDYLNFKLNKPVNLLSIYQKLPLLNFVGKPGQYVAPELRQAFIAQIVQDPETRDFALNTLLQLHDQPNLSSLDLDENLEIIYVNENRSKYVFANNRKRFEITFNNNGEVDVLFVFNRFSRARNNQLLIETRDPEAVKKLLPLAAEFLNSTVDPNQLIQTVALTLGLERRLTGWQRVNGLTRAALI